MLVGFLGLWLIAFSTGVAMNCDAKGYSPDQCDESIKNERLVTDPR